MKKATSFRLCSRTLSFLLLTMDTYTHINIQDHRGALDTLPNLPQPKKKQSQEAALKKTGTDDQPVGAYKKLTKKSDFCGHSQSSIVSSGGRQQGGSSELAGLHKSSDMAHLGIKNNPLSSSDNSGKFNEAEGTRTLSLRIDSPML